MTSGDTLLGQIENFSSTLYIYTNIGFNYAWASIVNKSKKNVGKKHNIPERPMWRRNKQ